MCPDFDHDFVPYTMEEQPFIPCQVRVQKPQPALTQAQIVHSHYKQKTNISTWTASFYWYLKRKICSSCPFNGAQHGNLSVILVTPCFCIEIEKCLLRAQMYSTSYNFKSISTHQLFNNIHKKTTPLFQTPQEMLACTSVSLCCKAIEQSQFGDDNCDILWKGFMVIFMGFVNNIHMYSVQCPQAIETFQKIAPQCHCK